MSRIEMAALMNLPELLGFRSELQVPSTQKSSLALDIIFTFFTLSSSKAKHHHRNYIFILSSSKSKVMKRAGDKVDAGIAALLAFLGVLLYSARWVVTILFFSASLIISVVLCSASLDRSLLVSQWSALQTLLIPM